MHNFSGATVNVTVRLPADTAAGSLDATSSGPATARCRRYADGRLNLELEPYGYHWFGRREGVVTMAPAAHRLPRQP